MHSEDEQWLPPSQGEDVRYSLLLLFPNQEHYQQLAVQLELHRPLATLVLREEEAV